MERVKFKKKSKMYCSLDLITVITHQVSMCTEAGMNDDKGHIQWENKNKQDFKIRL